jgi:nickel-dependent lactate racemase
MKNTVKLPQLSWYGVKDLDINFPEDWQVEVCKMAGYDRQGLPPAEIRGAIRNPLGVQPIRTLARGKKQVVVIFDDIQRSTRVAGIVPFILEELAEAGIPDSNVRFIGATGCHAAMNRVDFVKKLGEDVLRRFPVFSHNAFGNCVKIGTTRYGTDILANAEVMGCDLKIAVGGVVPHRDAGFSGGAKIVLPGICAFETNQAFHRFASEYRQKNNLPPARGSIENNPLRMNMDEAAKMVGLDIKIDVLTNGCGETVAVYAGKPEMAFEAAVKDARPHYLSARAREQDVVVVNAFSKVGEFESALEVAFPALRKEGGDVVLVGNSPGGHVAHYLFGSWGTFKRPGQMEHSLPPMVKHLYVLNEYPDLSIRGHFGNPEKVSLISSWAEVLASLKKSYSGPARAAVYPSADIML